MRILLVEDSAVTRTLAKHFLEKRGHRVVETASLREAMEALGGERAEPPDFVLASLDLPDADERELVRALRGAQPAGRLPIIALGRESHPGGDGSADATGVDASAPLPLHPDDILATARRLLATLEKARPSVESSRCATSQAAGASPFDKARFMSRVEGDPVLASEVVELFLEECPKLLDSVCQAAAGGDPKVLERAAHSLKGSVGDMAAPEAYEAARTLERLARQGTLGGIEDALANLEGAIGRLLPELHTFRSGAS